MKFLFVVVLLVCTNLGNAITGPQGCETTSKSEAVNIHVHCSAQEKNAIKPSAHLEPLDLREKTYAANQVIREWSLNSSSSHLAGGMKYNNGEVNVPIFGRYYIYSQVYFGANSGRPRILVMVNSAPVTLLQPMVRQGGNMFVAGVFKLNAGDVIMLKVAPHGPSTVYMSMRHCYFGAYLI
ncbi:lymphotoxin-alpha-like [Acropora muricata]|uniref:lymphotoxin-alpha-like n=1 Tax=Acropora muricata TaxID=159855 RepID=UPI0034E411FF